jgi:hypothetical protein
MNKKIVSPLEGLVNPDPIKAALKNLVAGDGNARSYIRGVRNFYKTTNRLPHVVQFLTKILEKYP